MPSQRTQCVRDRKPQIAVITSAELSRIIVLEEDENGQDEKRHQLLEAVRNRVCMEGTIFCPHCYMAIAPHQKNIGRIGNQLTCDQCEIRHTQTLHQGLTTELGGLASVQNATVRTLAQQHLAEMEELSPADAPAILRFIEKVTSALRTLLRAVSPGGVLDRITTALAHMRDMALNAFGLQIETA